MPGIRGLRIPVATIIGMVAEGMTTVEILEAYPDLEQGDIREALQSAAQAEIRAGVRQPTDIPATISRCRTRGVDPARGDPHPHIHGDGPGRLTGSDKRPSVYFERPPIVRVALGTISIRLVVLSLLF